MTTDIKEYLTKAEKESLSNAEIEARIKELLDLHQGGFGEPLPKEQQTQTSYNNEDAKKQNQSLIEEKNFEKILTAVEKSIHRHPISWLIGDNHG